MTDEQARVEAHTKTDDVVHEAELRELFSMEPEDGELDAVIGVCDGEWRADAPGTWRFWKLTSSGRLAAGYNITPAAINAPRETPAASDEAVINFREALAVAKETVADARKPTPALSDDVKAMTFALIDAERNYQINRHLWAQALPLVEREYLDASRNTRDAARQRLEAHIAELTERAQQAEAALTVERARSAKLAEAVEKLRSLSTKATAGPWESDTIDAEDGNGRYKARGALTENGVLFDTVNSSVQLIQSEHDEDGTYSWDEQGERDVEFAVAAVNYIRAALALVVDEHPLPAPPTTSGSAS